MLREFGFAVSGVACSFLDLIRRAHSIAMGGERLNAQTINNWTGPASVKGSTLDRSVSELQKVLSDHLYSSKKTMKEIFNEIRDDDNLIDLESFTFLCKKYAPTFTEAEIQKLYKKVIPKRGDKMNYTKFNSAYSWKIPEGNFEIEGLRWIWNWMHRAGLSAEVAFDKLAGGKQYLSK